MRTVKLSFTSVLERLSTSTSPKQYVTQTLKIQETFCPPRPTSLSSPCRTTLHPSIVEVTEWHLDNCFLLPQSSDKDTVVSSGERSHIVWAANNQSSLGFSITSLAMSPFLLSTAALKKSLLTGLWCTKHSLHFLGTQRRCGCWQTRPSPFEKFGDFPLLSSSKSPFYFVARVYFLLQNTCLPLFFFLMSPV